MDSGGVCLTTTQQRRDDLDGPAFSIGPWLQAILGFKYGFSLGGFGLEVQALRMQ